MLEIALSTLGCSIPGERFIGNFLIYLKGQLILKNYATVPAFESFHFYRRRNFFFIKVNSDHKLTNDFLNLKIKKALKIAYRFLLYNYVQNTFDSGYVDQSEL